MKKTKKTTRNLLNLKTIKDYCITGYNKNDIIYLAITPYNLSVLSDDNVKSKIFSLMNVINSLDNIEIVCINSRENFRYNKLNISKRISEETNPVIQSLLLSDLKYIDEIQVKTATARLFLLCIRVHDENNHEIHTYINRIEKSMKSHSFNVKKLDKNELKTLLAVSYTQNVTSDKFDDIDGERWLKNEIRKEKEST